MDGGESVDDILISSRGQFFISYGDSETRPPLSSLWPGWGWGAIGGQLLDRFQADLNRGLAAAIGIWSVFWMRSTVCTAGHSGIRLKLLFIKGARPAVPLRPPPARRPPRWPPVPLGLREIPKGVERRLARGKMSSALCG